MSDTTHTINELVDLALQTPEKGAVNFNILRVVLLKIIEKLDFGKEEVEYKPPDIRTSKFKLPDIKVPDFYETEVISKAEKIPDELKKSKKAIPKENIVETTPVRMKTKRITQDSSQELESKESKSDMQPDSTTQDEPEKLQDLEDTLQEGEVSSTTSETFSPESEEESEYESMTSEKDDEYEEEVDKEVTADEKEKSEPQTKRKEEDRRKRQYSGKKKKGGKEKRQSSPQKQKTDPEKRKSASKTKDEEPSTEEKKQMPSSMWHVWQMKKLTVKIDGVQDMINSVAKSVDELMKFKEERERRTKFEEGQKLESEYSSPYISREEFEDAIDDMGEAMARLFTNQKHQKEECNTINQNILKELNLKASVEDLNRHSEPINSKFRTLGTALRNVQMLIKDIIYPESCGITKCMACGRKSHLPLRCIVLDGKKDTSESKGDVESIIKISKEEKPEDLKFTHARLRRIEKHQKEKDQGVCHHTDQQDGHVERPLFPDYLVELETVCDADKLSKEFAPLRRFPDLKRSNTLYIPSVRPRKNPVSISIIGNDNSQILIKN